MKYLVDFNDNQTTIEYKAEDKYVNDGGCLSHSLMVF